jgi:hypothetical protein
MHPPEMQNPGGCNAGASRNQLGGWLQSPLTASEWQAQLLCRCFGMSQPLAHDMARLCFGEGSHD